MYTLRLNQDSKKQGEYDINLILNDGENQYTATTQFKFQIPPQEQEDLRWYFEDYLEYSLEPAPKQAALIERRIIEIGKELFDLVFNSSNDTRNLWNKLKRNLSDARIEIVTSGQDSVGVPWELLCDPDSNIVPSLKTVSFVRAGKLTGEQLLQPVNSSFVRILLVICRPNGVNDVRFRSVATYLIRALERRRKSDFQLDVLRPATFERLEEVLQATWEAGTPYHIVHFDGHGTYQEDPFRKGKRGFLWFETPTSTKGGIGIHGELLGKLLSKYGVSIVVINACRSAYAEALAEPQKTTTNDNRSLAFGSLADELISTGILGVVAMRYDVYVVTVAQFVTNLYEQLAQGYSLGEAVNTSRRGLREQPLRELSLFTLSLQDWCVPVVYEVYPLKLFTEKEQALIPKQCNLQFSSTFRRHKYTRVPMPQKIGFIGRDQILLVLDRAFNKNWLVLLYGYAGSGKTATANEFASWYLRTGGLPDGKVLFISFKQRATLTDILDQVGQAFRFELMDEGIDWLTLNYTERYHKVLKLLSEIPVFWVWDSVESIAGFPIGVSSKWTVEEQQELLGFLRETKKTKAKFLLTSRRNEQSWLGDLPTRVILGHMLMDEQIQLVHALAEKYSYESVNLAHWQPLLKFVEGNPLTLICLFSELLERNWHTVSEVNAFTAQLKTGTAKFQGEKGRERLTLLKDSLSYGFRQAFTEEEKRKLAYLRFFRTFVCADTYYRMGSSESDFLPELLVQKEFNLTELHSETEFNISELQGLTIEASFHLLDRATEIGLLTDYGMEEGLYFIHPALPCIFQELFGQPYRPNSSKLEESERQAQCRFAEVMGYQGNTCHDQFELGKRYLLSFLNFEEANLTYACQLAIENRLWAALMQTMQGLRVLYEETGRLTDWKNLLDKARTHLTIAGAEEALPGQELHWHWEHLLYHLSWLARKSGDINEAERLAKLRLDLTRKWAAAASNNPVETLGSFEKWLIKTLSSALVQLGDVLLVQHKPECLNLFEESLSLSSHIKDNQGQIISHFNIAQACCDNKMLELQDFDRAERCLKESEKLANNVNDNFILTQICMLLAQLYYQRYSLFKENQQAEIILQELDNAIDYDKMALDLCPSFKVVWRSEIRRTLARSYVEKGDFAQAIKYLQRSPTYKHSQEGTSNSLLHAKACFLQAITLMQSEYTRGVTWETDRLKDAHIYAETALSSFEQLGETELVNLTQKIIHYIDILMEPEPEENETNDNTT